MPDELTPEQQAVAAALAQQGTEWEARYKGSVKKIEELTLANRSLNEQLTTKTSEIEQLRAQLGVKDLEKTTAVSERDRLLQEALQKSSTMEQQLKDAQGMQLKIQVAKEIGHPELIKIMDRIPTMTDKETLTAVMKDFVDFAADSVKEREKQLLAGVTPGFGGTGQPQKVTPTNAKEWDALINSLPLGSQERNKAFDDYYEFLNKSQ
jgi:chromosome segregation ATPase